MWDSRLLESRTYPKIVLHKKPGYLRGDTPACIVFGKSLYYKITLNDLPFTFTIYKALVGTGIVVAVPL